MHLWLIPFSPMVLKNLDAYSVVDPFLYLYEHAISGALKYKHHRSPS